MTTDAFTTAARAEAERKYNEWVMSGGTGAVPLYREKILRTSERKAFRAGAGWARDHLAAQEATDAEVLAALNAQGVIVSPRMHPAPSLDYWGDRPAEAMRAALIDAKEARS